MHINYVAIASYQVAYDHVTNIKGYTFTYKSGLMVSQTAQTCWSTWPSDQSGCSPCMTHLWPTHWRFLLQNNMEKFWYEAFSTLGRVQNWFHAQTSYLRMESLVTTFFTTAWGSKLDGFTLTMTHWLSAFTRPKVHSHTRHQHKFSKEHVIY